MSKIGVHIVNTSQHQNQSDPCIFTRDNAMPFCLIKKNKTFKKMYLNFFLLSNSTISHSNPPNSSGEIMRSSKTVHIKFLPQTLSVIFTIIHYKKIRHEIRT